MQLLSLYNGKKKTNNVLIVEKVHYFIKLKTTIIE